jgi:hypothetical protein
MSAEDYATMRTDRLLELFVETARPPEPSSRKCRRR